MAESHGCRRQMKSPRSISKRRLFHVERLWAIRILRICLIEAIDKLIEFRIKAGLHCRSCDSLAAADNTPLHSTDNPTTTFCA